MVLAAVWAGCAARPPEVGGAEPIAPASPPRAAAWTEGPRPLPLGDPATGALTVTPRGDGAWDVWFALPGPNGCYRQGPTHAEADGSELRLSYTTSREGELCAMALVAGGVSGVWRPVGPPPWRVVVVVDGVERARAAETP